MKLKFIEKKEVAPNIYTFSFEKPTKFKYFAGQYCYVELDNINSDPRGNLRQFTLSSSPTEDFISFTTFIGPSVYKQKLFLLKEGQRIIFDGPHGVLHFNKSSKKNNIFIAKDLGVTPFRSILKYIADTNIETNTKLIHINENKLFEDEMNFFVNNLTNYQYIKLNSENISENLEYKIDTDYWVVGPTKMVTNIENFLYKLKISEENILTEKFSGY